MTLQTILPLVFIITANIIYNITTKNTPQQVNPFLSLCISYIVAIAGTLMLYLLTAKTPQPLEDLRQLNWTTYVLGLSIIALEGGYIFLYRAGWKISVGSLVCNIILALALVLIGALFYNEGLGLKQILGIGFCLFGLFLVNL